MQTILWAVFFYKIFIKEIAHRIYNHYHDSYNKFGIILKFSNIRTTIDVYPERIYIILLDSNFKKILNKNLSCHHYQNNFGYYEGVLIIDKPINVYK